MKKTYRNGNGVLDVANSATGPEAEKLRAVARWNGARERSALRRGKSADAQRFAANRALCNLSLVALATGAS